LTVIDAIDDDDDNHTDETRSRELELAGEAGDGGGNSGFKIETDNATTSDDNTINIGITM
jgi:hypothetical protein